jgi:hypothetical protein
MSHERDSDEDSLHANRSDSRLRFDERSVVVTRMNALADTSQKECFDDVFAEFDERHD